jgi:DNA-binding GntR family transcriptional regulator
MVLSELIAALCAGRVATPDVIADVLRTTILRGQLPSGQPLRQDEIAAYFSVSRIPVREAMRRLTAEGLVEFRERRGFLVAAMKPEESHEILEIRATLEIKAVSLAMPRWTEETFAALGVILDESESTSSIDAWSELNWHFHETLYQPAQRPRLLATISSLNVNVDRYIRLLLSQSDYRLQAQREHRAILASASVRNLPALNALIEQHAGETAVRLKEFLDSYESPGRGIAKRPETKRLRAIG